MLHQTNIAVLISAQFFQLQAGIPINKTKKNLPCDFEPQNMTECRMWILDQPFWQLRGQIG